MIIRSNLFTFILRMALIPAFIWMIVYPVNRWMNNGYTDQQIKLLWIGLTFFVIFLALVIISLFGVFKIVVRRENCDLELHHLFSRKVFNVKDITGYYATSFRTRGDTYEGLILKMKDGRNVEVTEYNLESLYELNQYLIEQGVQCIGQKKSKFPFKTKL